jgi:transcriptional regulator with XRE-family HTH domain
MKARGRAKSTHSATYRALLEALKEARATAGFTQAEVARQLRRPQSYVSKVESGERRVDVIELADLCRLYGLDLCQFLRGLVL